MKITYIFGAGASANALPTVQNIPDRLIKFIDFLDLHLFRELKIITLSDIPRKPDSELQKLKNDINWLIEGSKQSASIDTFARKLYIRKENEKYFLLKKLLMIFFFYEQFKNERINIDNRYDSFFAYIIKKDILTLTDIKILSWNYDTQFEMAFSEYSMRDSLLDNQIFLQVYPSEELKKPLDENKFLIIKLNGSLQKIALNEDIFSIYPEIQTVPTNDMIAWIKKEYLSKPVAFPFLFFAWESDNDKHGYNPTKTARDLCIDTDILVVIGYSFPIFNRTFDREIIRAMVNLKKVYFQAPKDDIQNYFFRFQSIRPDIKPEQTMNIPDTKEFFLPPELD